MIRKTWIWIQSRIRAVAGDERGASMVEYAMMVALAVLVAVVAVQSFSNTFVGAVNYISDTFSSALNAS